MATRRTSSWTILNSCLLVDNTNLSTGDIDFTIGAWIKPESVGSTERMVLAKGDVSSAASLEYALLVTDNQAQFAISDGIQYATITSRSPIVPGYWYFIVAWHDSLTDQIGIQVNDSTPDVGSWTYGSWDSNFAFSIGGDSLPSRHFDGLIDEAFLYKRLLTTDEREWLRNTGLGRSYAELLSAPTATVTVTTSALPATPTFHTNRQRQQSRQQPHQNSVIVIQTVIVTVPYIIIENGNGNDVAMSGGGGSTAGGSTTTGVFSASTPYAWQNVYGTGASSCGGYSISVRVYVDYNEDKMMSPAEGVTDLQIFFLDQSYTRLGSAYTRDGQATFCISPTQYGRTIYIDIPYLQKFNGLSIPSEPKQDLEIWFAGEAPALPLFLP